MDYAKTIGLVVALISMSFTNTYADLLSTRSLSESCSYVKKIKDDNRVYSDGRGLEAGLESNYCGAYVRSITDINIINKKICPDESIMYDQFLSVVINYMDNHPEKWNYPAAIIATEALKESFPCKKRTK